MLHTCLKMLEHDRVVKFYIGPKSVSPPIWSRPKQQLYDELPWNIPGSHTMSPNDSSGQN